MRKGILVYYVVSPVHLRNVDLLASALPGWTIRVTYEEPNLYITQLGEREKPFEEIPIVHSVVPASLWEGGVRAVIFSTIQPRLAPLHLLREAWERGTPTIAIEESNQMALNSGAVNNYLLPVDALFVASRVEEAGMRRDGLLRQYIEITGWPFFHGEIVPVTPSARREAKLALGLDLDRPVASLTLTALYAAGESHSARERQMRLSAEGLPPDFQLAIKPHPVEKRETLAPFVEKFAPSAIIFDGAVPIAQFLAATDILLNRGVSHVVFEALLLGVPIVVLDTGIHTPFHQPAPELIAHTPAEVSTLCQALVADEHAMSRYESFRQSHAPLSPPDSLRLTAARIESILENPPARVDAALDWFVLAAFLAWQKDVPAAAKILTRPDLAASSHPVAALHSLIHRQATLSDLAALTKTFSGTFHENVIRALWIAQGSLSDEHLPWLADFPPFTHTPLFHDDVLALYRLLEHYGHSDATEALYQKMAVDYRDVAGVPRLLRKLRPPPLPPLWKRMIFSLREFAGVKG